MRFVASLVWTLIAIASASTATHVLAGDLKTSSGGTGQTRSGGNGGTGVSTSANAPIASLTPSFKPLHVTLPPQAGIRPHTDLAAAMKRNTLASKRLIKPSSLYNKVHAPHRDPHLMAAVLKKIAYPDGGGSSFKTLRTIKAEESNGRIYPTNGGTTGRHEEAATLNSGTHEAHADLDHIGGTDYEESPGDSNWLLKWLFNLAALAGSTGVAWLLWHQFPKGARMTLPTALPA